MFELLFDTVVLYKYHWSSDNWPVSIVTIAETSSLKSRLPSNLQFWIAYLAWGANRWLLQFTSTAEQKHPFKPELWASQLPIVSFSVCGAGQPSHCVSLWHRLPAHVNKAACSANPSRCWLLSQRVTVCQSTPGAHDKERTFACLLMFEHTCFAQGELKKQNKNIYYKAVNHTPVG